MTLKIAASIAPRPVAATIAAAVPTTPTRPTSASDFTAADGRPAVLTTPTPIPHRFASNDPLAAGLADPSAAHGAHDNHGASGTAAVGHSQHHGNHGVHGMVMFGGGSSLFLSHIPMFEAPHNRQVLLEVSAPSLAGKSFSDGAFTFQPEAFSLDALVSGDLKTIRGTVFSGNFESGGEPIAANVELTVKSIPTAAPLDPSAPAAKSLEYFVMGSGQETFLVHRISSSPDFDQVLKVSLESSGLTPEELASGAKLVFPDRAEDVSKRLRPGESVDALVMPSGKKVKVTVARELSVLVGPDFMAPPQS